MTPTKNENSPEGFDTQIPRESYVYYENTFGSASGIYVSGDYAYVAIGFSGLAAIDISDPTNPGTSDWKDTGGFPSDVYVSGDYAYMAGGANGLIVMDISDPTNLGNPAYEDTNGLAHGVYVSGDYAYVADDTYGLTVIDITHPTNPGTPVYEDTTGIARGVYVSGDYAYVADHYGLAVIDISDPTNPGTPVYEGMTGSAYDVYVSGNYAYVANFDGLVVIDISNPTNPGSPVYEDTTGEAQSVYVSGNYAYMGDGNSGLAVIDISDPTDPGTPVYEATTGYGYGVYVSGDYAYVADGSDGLAVIDISEPINPGTPFYEDTTGEARGVYVSGDYAYLACGTAGLAVIDISNPTNPGLPVYEATTGSAYSVYVSGDYAYVAIQADAPGMSNGLAVIDISDPTNPGAPAYEDTAGGAYDVYVSGDYAYLACGTAGLVLIDISNPTNPGLPVYEDTTGFALGVYVSGNYAYVGDGNTGLAVIDISDQTDPGTPVYEATTGYGYGVYVSGDYAYVANGVSGLAVIDISDPTNPGTPFYEDTTEGATEVYVSGDYAYVADFGSGLAVIDISNPTNPGTPVYEGTTSDAWDIYVSGDYTYVADFTSGLAVIQVRKRVEMVNPLITNAPSDIAVEFGYSGQSISWTATDPNPSTYTIELQGSGVVAGPTTWLSDVAITYNVPDGFSLGVYVYTVNFMDDYGNIITESVTFTVGDITNPIITNSPSDLVVEFGYTGQSISWTATDLTPNIYTIELQGSGIVAGPTAWVSGEAHTYYIPESFALGVYVYMVNFTDDYGNFITENVTFTVSDMTDPSIISAPSDLSVEFGYTGQSISWTATDLTPNIYTIELQGSGIVAGPTAWTSGLAITYDIPDGLVLRDYIYIVTFTDDYGNFITENVTFIVGDTTNPTILSAPSDLVIIFGETGQSISWTATDSNPGTYTVELLGSGIVAGPTTWTSDVAITYNIPDDLPVGTYVYTVNFTDDYGNFIEGSVTFTVNDDISNPTIMNTPDDFTVDFGYTGQSISWTAMDLNPHTYTIDLQGSGIVDGPIAWTSGVSITYNIPDSLAVGTYVYTVNFTDDFDHFITESFTLTVVDDITNPIISNTPSDLTVEFGYTGQIISWTATDWYPNTYTIELQGSGIIVGPTAWTSGVALIYNIPDGFALGDYVYTVTFTDDYGNFNVDNVTFTVEDTTNPTITNTPSDLTVEFGYTGQSISWTAMDSHPNTYTIELQGSGVVAGPTAWTSGAAIRFDIPDSFAVDVYVYTVTFTDDSGNSITDSVTFRVEDVSADDTTDPIITNPPSDITVEVGYTGQSISWTATDVNPHTYTIELEGVGIVVEAAAWISDLAITYNILNGNPAGVYVYTITFTDDSGNVITDSVTFTVEAGETGNGDDEGGGIPGARFEITLLISIGTVASIVMVKKKRYRSNGV
jgi:hypothetical protein